MLDPFCRHSRLTTQTGLRISELIGLTVSDAILGVGVNVHCVGKGRKERATPLKKLTVRVLRSWLTERGGAPASVNAWL